MSFLRALARTLTLQIRTAVSNLLFSYGRRPLSHGNHFHRPLLSHLGLLHLVNCFIPIVVQVLGPMNSSQANIFY